MKKTLVVLSVVGMIMLAAGTASAAGWLEDFESYDAGPLPTDPASPWVYETTAYSIYVGTPGTVVTDQAKSGTKSWQPGLVSASEHSRIARAIGEEVVDNVSLGAWFYGSTDGGSKRSFVGFQNGFATDTSLLRIGTNNSATFLIHWYNGSGVTTIDTAVAANIGWYYLQLDMSKVDATNWQCAWTVTPDGGTGTNGSTQLAWTPASDIVLGLQYGTTNVIDFDDVSVDVTVIPEPGSLLALGSGLIGLVGFGIRRRR